MSSIENRIKQQQQDVQKSVLDDMKRKGDEYFDLIVNDAAREIKRLPEATFVKSFLPYFCGEEPIEGRNNIIALWIGIAGSTTSKVNIVDNKGEVIFTVPPINDTSIIDVNNKNKGQGFKNIVQNYQLYANQTPASADNYLNRTIGGRLDRLRAESEVFNQNEAIWVSIFQRYGKMKDTVVKKEQRPTSLDDDELLYD